MKTLYFISNNLISPASVIYPKSTTFHETREKMMLSLDGENLAESLCSIKDLASIEAVYSSNYFCAMDTSKYLAETNKIEIFVDERLGERLVGDLGGNEIRFLKGMQEHDFSYKLPNGESIQEVTLRMKNCVKDILKNDYEEVAVVTHPIALLSLFTLWCNKGFSLEDRLILDYHEDILFDGSFHEIDLIKVVFDENRVISIERIK